MSAEPDTTQTPWSVGRLLTWTTDHFERHGVDEPRLCAEILLAHAMDCERIYLYTRFDEVPEASILASFRELVRRGACHAPVAYMVGHKEFFSLSFEVTPDVLIPRPETETLVERAVVLRESGAASPYRVLDVGTGSGCVIVTLLTRTADCRGVATDISREALDVARRNAAQHGVADRVEFLKVDRLVLPADVVPEGGFDLLVSNPPYVADEQMADLPSNVREHEPAIALNGGADGLDFYRAIADDAADLLVDHGSMLLEIGAGQHDAVTGVMTGAGVFSHVGTYRSPTDPHDRVMHFAKV